MDTSDCIADHPVTSGAVVATGFVGDGREKRRREASCLEEVMGIRSSRLLVWRWPRLQNLQLNAMTCLNATNLRNLQERR